MPDVQQHQVEQLIQQVDQLAKVQRYEDALELAGQAWALARELGEDHPLHALSLYHLGLLCVMLGNHDAEPLLLHALQIRRVMPGDNSRLISQTLNTLALFYVRTRNLAKADAAYQEVLRITQTPSWEAAVTLKNLGMVRKLGDDLTRAAAYYEQALEIYRVVRGMTHTETIATMDSLVEVLMLIGKFDRAEPLLQQRVLSLRQSGEESMDLAKALKKLGDLYTTQGDLAQAEESYRQSQGIVRQLFGENHEHYGVIASNIGLLYQSLGDYDRAIELLTRALTIFRSNVPANDPRIIADINNLGMAYLSAWKFSEAEPLLVEALTRARAVPKNGGLMQAAKSLNALAILYTQRGDHNRAETALRESLELRRLFGEGSPFYAVGLQNLAQWHQDQGDYVRSEQMLIQAIQIMRSTLGEYNPSTAAGMTSLAEVHAATGRIGEALALMDQVCALFDFSIGNVFSFGSDRQRLEYLKTVKGDLDRYLSLVSAHRSNSPEAVHKAFDLLLRRKALTVEALAAQRDAILGGRRPDLASSLRELAAIRMEIGQSILTGLASAGLEAHRQALALLFAKRESLENELARNLPEVKLEQLLRNADRRAVAAALPAGMTLIEFARYNFFDFRREQTNGKKGHPARYVAFVLPAGKPNDVQMVDLGDAEPIEQLIADFRASITGESESRAAREMLPISSQTDDGQQSDSNLGRALRGVVFDKLIPALAGSNRLLIAADGELARLPFEVLPTSDGSRVIDEFSISYLNCGRDVLRFGALPSVKPGEPLVVADPDFDLGAIAAFSGQERTRASRPSRDLDRDVRFSRLPGTRREGERIAAMLGVSPWFDAAALEGRLKTHHSPRILHLATHGFFLQDQDKTQNTRMHAQSPLGAVGGTEIGQMPSLVQENPLLRSGLALAGANRWSEANKLPAAVEDGLLTAEDVSGLDLLATELVVLSACETGLGQIHVGEGVFGLRRAFVQAGAKTLVMSLWKVPDDQTQELMELFYGGILAGQGRSDALRSAQLTMRARYPNPYYWAAFICQGDPSPLPSSSSAS